MVSYRGETLSVDILLELEPYMDKFGNYKIRGDKLQGTSPFRDETNPSFAVRLDNGLFVDSGAVDDFHYKGNFIALLAFLRSEEYEDTWEYLKSVYSLDLADIDELELDLDLSEDIKEVNPIDLSELPEFKQRSSYLNGRGISDKVQGAFKIGYDKEQKAIAVPWFDNEGNVINIKYRATKSKFFWYYDKGRPIKDYVYGLHFAKGYDTVVLTESETDCMYLWSNGIPAIALGGAYLSKKQQMLLEKTKIKESVLGFDNDVAGYRCSREVIKKSIGKMILTTLSIPEKYKDVNEVPSDELSFLFERRNKLELSDFM
jgi:DNA primase